MNVMHLTLNRLVFLVDGAVLPCHAQSGVHVHARECIEGVVHHVRDHAARGA